MRSEGGMKVMAWVMLAAVVFGLGGYGVTNFGGSVTSIGTVGDQEVSNSDYLRALQQELDSYRAQLGQTFTAEQALQIGMDASVRQRLITTAALDSEDDRLGISVGNAALRAAIEAMPAFKGPDGKFSKDTYAFTLRQNGLTVPGFEAKMRIEQTRTLLQQALTGAVPAPKVFVDTLVAYAGERRGFTLLKIGAADLPTPVAAPTDAELQAYYDAHKADFTAPDAKIITYAALTPEMEAAKVTIDDKTLQDLYAEKKSQFVTPEKRLVERLVYPTEADAQAAKAALDAGTKTFEQLVADRGLQMNDVDMGDVTQDGLSKDAGAAVFALTAPGVTGPVNSALGPALFRMNGIIAAQTTGFDQAKDQLAQGLKDEKARQMISDQVEAINDKLAGGATLEDLAKETDMQIGQLDFTPGDSAGMAAYPAFRDAAAAAKDGDFPQLIQLKDGGIAALRLDKIRPAALIPYDKVADKVKAGWTAEATAKALVARATEIAAAVKGGADIASFGSPETEAPMTRQDVIEGTPQGLVPAVFKLAASGDLGSMQEGDAGYVYRLDSIAAPKADDPDVVKMRQQFAGDVTQGITQDSFDMFATALVADTKVSIDKMAVAAVNAQFH
ncbi:MAG: peptidylprolyl isomerase [Rhodobacteraceae bacterium]|nr:peptidylprolyl isomerase [Paracoccaceae bacterium]